MVPTTEVLWLSTAPVLDVARVAVLGWHARIRDDRRCEPLKHEAAAGCHRLCCPCRRSDHWRVRRPGHGQTHPRLGCRPPDPAPRHQLPRHCCTPRDRLRRHCCALRRSADAGHAEKVEILERAGQMVLAAHRTPVGSRLTAVTVDTVTLDAEADGLPAAPRTRAPRNRDLHLRRQPTGPGSPTPASSARTFGGSARPGVNWSPAVGSRRSGSSAAIKTER